MTLLKPQPPEETLGLERIGNTDSFDCVSAGGEFLAVVHRTLSSKDLPVFRDGNWYWTEERE